MEKRTIRLDGKKHSIPRCFEYLFVDLEALVGVEAVGTRNFWQKGQMTNRLEIKYYDLTTHTLKINAMGYGWVQELYVRINPSKIAEIVQYIENYSL